MQTRGGMDLLELYVADSRETEYLQPIIMSEFGTLLSKQYRIGKDEMLCSTHGRMRKNSVDLVRKRTIPTERPPLVGEF
jgi:hypothetical protein